MQEGEKAAKSTAEENDVITVTDRAREGLLVGIQTKEYAIEDGIRRG